MGNATLPQISGRSTGGDRGDGGARQITETLAGSGRLRRPALQPSARHGGCLRTLRAELSGKFGNP